MTKFRTVMSDWWIIYCILVKTKILWYKSFLVNQTACNLFFLFPRTISVFLCYEKHRQNWKRNVQYNFGCGLKWLQIILQQQSQLKVSGQNPCFWNLVPHYVINLHTVYHVCGCVHRTVTPVLWRFGMNTLMVTLYRQNELWCLWWSPDI